MALRVIVLIPFYLQEWLQILTWKKSDCARALVKIFSSVEVSDRDRAFFEDVMSSKSDWLTSDDGTIHEIVHLTFLLLQKLNGVSVSICVFFI
jgi:hypothetical protein